MRWWMLACGLMAVSIFVAGCGDPAAGPAVTVSLLTFHYDPSRDVALATTRDAVVSPSTSFITSTPVMMKVAPPEVTIPSKPYSTVVSSRFPNINRTYAVVSPGRLPKFGPYVSPQEYADLIAPLPVMSFCFGPDTRFANPCPTAKANVLTVNYRNVCGTFTCDEATAIVASLETWWWVPSVCTYHFQADGKPIKNIGGYFIGDPWQHTFHTFVVQEQTGEIGFLVSGLHPRNLKEGLDILASRDICPTPAAKGFVPMLPPGVNFTAYINEIKDGVLPFDFSGSCPTNDKFRMAAIILMLTQFPGVNAVQFYFNGQIIDQPFMRSNLNRPLTAADLILPTTVALLPETGVNACLRTSVQASLGREPAFYGDSLVWGNWACMQVVPEKGGSGRTYILHKTDETYQVFASGTDLSPVRLLRDGMPREAIIALRLPHWEDVILVEEQLGKGEQ